MRKVKVKRHFRRSKRGHVSRVRNHHRTIRTAKMSYPLSLRKISRTTIPVGKNESVNIEDFLRLSDREGKSLGITTGIQGRGKNAPDVVPLSGELGNVMDLDKVNAENVTLRVGEPMKSILEKNMPRSNGRIAGIKHDTLEVIEDYLKRKAFRTVDADKIKAEANYKDGILTIPTLADRASGIVARRTRKLQQELGQKPSKISYMRDLLKKQRKKAFFQNAPDMLVNEFYNRYDRVPLTPDDFSIIKSWADDKKILGSTLFKRGLSEEDETNLEKLKDDINKGVDKLQKKVTGTALMSGAMNDKITALIQKAGGNKHRAMEWVNPSSKYHITESLGIKDKDKQKVRDGIKKLIDLEKAAVEELQPKSRGAPGVLAGSSMVMTPDAKIIKNTLADLSRRNEDDPIRSEQLKLLKDNYGMKVRFKQRNPYEVDRVTFGPRKRR